MRWSIAKVGDLGAFLVPRRSRQKARIKADASVTLSILKGDILDNETSLDCNIHLHVNERPGGRVAYKNTHVLYSCSLDDAPETIENNRMSAPCEYNLPSLGNVNADEELPLSLLGIEKVGEIEFSLEDVDWDALESVTLKNNSKKYILPIDINIRMGDESGVLIFRVMYKGKEAGKAELAFSHT